MTVNDVIKNNKRLQKSIYCITKCSECGKDIWVRWDLAQNKDLDNFVCNHCLWSKNAKKNLHTKEADEKASQSRYNKCDSGRYHQKNGQYEHRAIMEEHLGRKLTKNEIVHHKDGDKHNNSIDNLQIMSRQEHSRMHRLEYIEKHGVKKVILTF